MSDLDGTCLRQVASEGLKLPRPLVVGDEIMFSGYTPNKKKKPIGLFDLALTGKDGYFVGDVALRFWVREDGDGETAPARGLSRMAKVCVVRRLCHSNEHPWGG